MLDVDFYRLYHGQLMVLGSWFDAVSLPWFLRFSQNCAVFFYHFCRDFLLSLVKKTAADRFTTFTWDLSFVFHVTFVTKNHLLNVLISVLWKHNITSSYFTDVCTTKFNNKHWMHHLFNSYFPTRISESEVWVLPESQVSHLEIRLPTSMEQYFLLGNS